MVIKTPEERAEGIVRAAYGQTLRDPATDWDGLHEAIADVIRAAEAAVDAATVAEREACAALCDRLADAEHGETVASAVAAIRLRKTAGAIRGRGR
jgi:hypothetical protein